MPDGIFGGSVSSLLPLAVPVVVVDAHQFASSEPAATVHSATQSVGVGEGIPVQLNVNLPLLGTIPGLTDRPMDLTSKGLLMANRVNELFENNRSSYDPVEMLAGSVISV